jgi:signal peptidase
MRLHSRKQVHSPNNARRAVFYVLTVVIIVVGAQLLLSNELGSSPIYVVVSSSMVPTLQIGDLVVAQSVPFSSVRVGDVIIYVQPDGLGGCQGLTIVHRVVAITSQGLITQGDNRETNPRPDEPYRWPPVTANCVKGKVVLAVPYLGLISMVIPPPYNYLIVGLILVFVFLSELWPQHERDNEDDDGGREVEQNSRFLWPCTAA